MREIRTAMLLVVTTALAVVASLLVPGLTPAVDAQEAFSCEVVDDVLSWTDQGATRYQIRQINGDTESYLTAVEGALSLALDGNADAYVVRYREGLNTVDTTCAGNPSPDFTCMVVDDVLSWTDQGASRYQIRQINGDTESYLTAVEGALSLVLDGTADSYVVRVRLNGVVTETSCAGNPAPPFTCTVVDGLLSWSDQGASVYRIRQVVGDVESYLGATALLSFPVSGFADTYVVRIRSNGVITETSCAGEPLPEFTCEIVFDFDTETATLTWTDQMRDRYQVRAVVDGEEFFLGTVDGATELLLGDVLAEEYVVRYRQSGIINDARCSSFILL